MLIKDLKDCREFVAGDGSVLRELLHPDKTGIALRYSLAHAEATFEDLAFPHHLWREPDGVGPLGLFEHCLFHPAAG